MPTFCQHAPPLIHDLRSICCELTEILTREYLVTNDCLQNKTSFPSATLFCYRKILQIKISAIQGVHFKITYDTQVEAISPFHIETSKHVM